VRAALAILFLFTACRNQSSPPGARAERKRAQAVAQQDRAILQAYIKRAEATEAGMDGWATRTNGFKDGDTNVVWREYVGPDSAIVLDEHRRFPGGGTGSGRYFFRRGQVWYVTFDRMLPGEALSPLRTRFAFAFDSTNRLVATSKNVNDAAVPLDTATDVIALQRHAQDLLARVQRAP
jgi:hypothetical protein